MVNIIAAIIINIAIVEWSPLRKAKSRIRHSADRKDGSWPKNIVRKESYVIGAESLDVVT